MLRSLQRLMKNRNFLLCSIAYPICYCVFLYFKSYINVHPFDQNTVNWYSTLSFILFAFMTVLTVYEVIEKRLFHKIQGDKLKIKQHQKDWRN